MASTNSAALLRAACTDVGCAEKLLAAQATRNLIVGDRPDHLEVLTAIRHVLDATEHAEMRPDLVASYLEGEAPRWLFEPAGQDVEDFPVFLGAAIAAHDKWRLGHIARAGVDELTAECAISPKTRDEILRFLTLPSAGQVTARRDTDYRSVANRSRKEGVHLINTGFFVLDKQMSWDFGRPIGTPQNRFPGGFRTGDLVLVAAESGTGKTTFSVEMGLRSTMLFNVLNEVRRSFVIFSEEQTATELISQAGFKHRSSYWRRQFDEAGWKAHFVDPDDYGKASVESVIAYLVELVREEVAAGRDEGLDAEAIRARLPLVVVVDYAKLFAPEGMPLVQGLDAVGRTLKAMVGTGRCFKSLNYAELHGYAPAIILPTQAARPKTGAVARGEWRPDLDSLQDCRSLRDHAALIFGLWREDAVEAAILKARRGTLSKAPLWTPMVTHGPRWFSNAKEVERQGPTVEAYRRRHLEARDARQRPHQRS